MRGVLTIQLSWAYSSVERETGRQHSSVPKA